MIWLLTPDKKMIQTAADIMQSDTIMNIDLSYLRSVSGGNLAFEKLLLANAVTDIQSNIDHLQTAWLQHNAAKGASN